MHTLPYLSVQEINDLCYPVTQKAAQRRKLSQLFGLAKIEMRPDGTPIIGRKLAEEKLNYSRQAAGGFAWSK